MGAKSTTGAGRGKQTATFISTADFLKKQQELVDKQRALNQERDAFAAANDRLKQQQAQEAARKARGEAPPNSGLPHTPKPRRPLTAEEMRLRDFLNKAKRDQAKSDTDKEADIQRELQRQRDLQRRADLRAKHEDDNARAQQTHAINERVKQAHEAARQPTDYAKAQERAREHNRQQQWQQAQQIGKPLNRSQNALLTQIRGYQERGEPIPWHTFHKSTLRSLQTKGYVDAGKNAVYSTTPHSKKDYQTQRDFLHRQIFDRPETPHPKETPISSIGDIKVGILHQLKHAGVANDDLFGTHRPTKKRR